MGVIERFPRALCLSFAALHPSGRLYEVRVFLSRSHYHCFIGKTTWSGNASHDFLVRHSGSLKLILPIWHQRGLVFRFSRLAEVNYDTVVNKESRNQVKPLMLAVHSAFALIYTPQPVFA